MFLCVCVCGCSDSLQHGWELLGICLSFFPPSARFSVFLEGYLYRQLTSDDVSDDVILFLLTSFAASLHHIMESQLSK